MGVRDCSTLWVYELKGEAHPAGFPEDGLEGMWPEAPYYYLFYRKEALEPILEWLKSNFRWRLTAQYRLPYDRWQDIPVSRTLIGPFRIHSSAESGTTASESGTIPIRLDPGVVFGSGLHPTTGGCLRAIAEFFERSEIRTAVDFGTGTGILAVACALLGARRVWAVDCNPLALRVAAKNASGNGVADRVGFLAANRPGVFRTSADLLVMNLELPILQSVLLGGEWKNYRRIVLSGFLEGKLAAVEDMIGPGFHVAGASIYDGWPVLSLLSCR